MMVVASENEYTVGMISWMLRASLFAILLANDAGEWKPVSEKMPEIEFRWRHPLRNSCELSLRDLRAQHQTRVSITIFYLPHKGRKASVETRNLELTLGGPGSAAEEHISGCEEPTSFTVNAVSRE